MKVCLTIHSIDKNAGGTSSYIQLIANELINYEDISLITFKSQNPLSLDSKVQINLASDHYPTLQGYSREFKYLIDTIDCDIFHGNGIWQYPVHYMAKIAQNKKIPYIISPHGSLDSWQLGRGKIKKRAALWLYQRKDLALASCILTTSKKEADNIRKLGFKNPVAIIPNGIDLSEFIHQNKNPKKDIKTILYLSRIHPSKGIEMLIEAWGYIPASLKNRWQIKIAGNGDSGYIESLKKLINMKGFQNEILIIGPLFGSKKIEAYQEADLFVLPTYTENFGIVIAEALACGVPVITTKGAPWEKLITYNAGWWIDIGIEHLATSLEQALLLDDNKRYQMGQNGRKLVEERYSILSVGLKMRQLYKWVLNGGEKPDFIYTENIIKSAD